MRQWSILAIYGSELKKSEAASGGQDVPKATQLLRSVWHNVISTPGSAREARTSFETGYGDALITYELEGLTMKQASEPFDIVIPKATIFSEHPAVMIDRSTTPEKQPVVEAFMNYLWSDEAAAGFRQTSLPISDERCIQRRQPGVRKDRDAVYRAAVRRVG